MVETIKPHCLPIIWTLTTHLEIVPLFCVVEFFRSWSKTDLVLRIVLVHEVFGYGTGFKKGYCIMSLVLISLLTLDRIDQSRNAHHFLVGKLLTEAG